ncbi:phosphonate ABC transporter ATP-binding protein [Rubritepida flocculans]|uniref:phosphonate ABC transporter ATP-binding protein n=1 Tax=Rubritepida flocculans TaxID=182403 RepID=UPI00040F8F77|nr:ATP-binding cassette domain-containing protein [Rubritepida flocculans]
MSATLTLAAPLAAPPPGPDDLRIEGLVKRFGATEVLRGVRLRVPRGQLCALIGANGAGKSTLLRCLLRLVEPDAGAIEVLGEDARRLRGRALRRLRARVGFVFQRHNLVPRLSALSNVTHGAIARAGALAWHQALAPRALRAEAMRCLEEVGLAPLALRRAEALSGGQSQRVAIARALMQRPEMILADEPVASLDPAAGREVMGLLAGLARQRGITVLFSTHHMEHATAFADRIVALRGGAVAFDCPAAAASPAALERVFA